MTTYSEEAVKAILDTAKVQADMLKGRIAELEDGVQEILTMAENKNDMQVIGLMMIGPISRKLREILES